MNRFTIWKILLFVIYNVIFSVSFTADVVATPKLHAFIVANTIDNYPVSDDGPFAGNSNDGSKAYRKSVALIQSELRLIKRYTKLDLKVYDFTGNKFKKEMFLNALNNVTVGKEDVVLIYYAGHGFGSNAETTNYPYLIISRKYSESPRSKIYQTDGQRENLVVSGKKIHKIIEDKKPRLSIILYETCNTPREITEANDLFGIFKSMKRKNYEDLYEKARGHIYLSAAKKGNAAGFDRDGKIGGFFTSFFIKNLHDILSEERVTACSWYDIAANTIAGLKVFTKRRTRVQEAFGDVVLYDKYKEEIICDTKR